jgi:hypothetical protein
MSNTTLKPSALKYRAMIKDVEARASYALYSGDRTNPYSLDDKRYDRFEKTYQHVLFLDAVFEDMCDVMGSPTNKFTRKVHLHPGPVKTLEELVHCV